MLKDVTSRISYSKIATYCQCPHRWKLQYVSKINVGKQSIEFIYGTAVHEVIQQFLTKYYSEYTLSYIQQNKQKLITVYTDFLVQRFMSNLQEKKKADATLIVTDDEVSIHLQYAIKLLQQFIPTCHKYFPKLNTQLVGIQVQLTYPLDCGVPFTGFIDVLIKNKKTGLYTIYDLKTSRMGWKDRQKKDEMKRLQLLLYKHFLSKQLDIQIDNIDIQFLILKKIIYEKSQYKISRLQKFIPPSAKGTLNKSIIFFNDTIQKMEWMSNNPDESQSMKNINNCKYCPYNKLIFEGEMLCNPRSLKSLKSKTLRS